MSHQVEGEDRIRSRKVGDNYFLLGETCRPISESLGESSSGPRTHGALIGLINRLDSET